MKTLSEETFETLAGSAAYQRGKKVYQDGKVGELKIDKISVEAIVEGTLPYQVTLHHTPKIFEGECTCPASNNFDFCKHCVAVALKYYYQTQTNQELADLPADNRLLGFLNTLSKPDLAEELHTLISADQELFDQWQLRAEISSGGLSASSIRKRITKAVPYKPSGLWRYRDVAEYFANCRNKLSVLKDALFSLPAYDASKLIAYALQRHEKTLHTIDDSGGYRLDFETMLLKWFDQNQSQNDWETGQRVGFFAGLMLDEKFAYDSVNLTEKLSQFCTTEEQNKIYQEINKSWSELNPESEQYSDAHYYFRRLERYLLQRARSQSDLDNEFKILERGAVNVQRCLELVDVCIRHKRYPEAHKWLDYAGQIQQLGQRDIYEIETAKIALLKAEKDYQSAIKLEWARFEEDEDAELLEEVLNSAQHIDERQIWLDKGLEFLNSRLDRREQSQKNRHRARSLAQVYLANQQFDQALALSRTSLLAPETLMTIVNAAPELNPKVFSLIEKSVNLYLQMAGQMVYERAVKFLLKQHRRVLPEQEAQFENTIQAIFSEPKNLRKTNFIKRLKAAFPDYF